MNIFAQPLQSPFQFPVASSRTGALRLIGGGAAERASQTIHPTASVVVIIGSSQVGELKSRGPVDIRCLSGWLWITTDGDIRDTILRGGQRHNLTRAVRGVLLSAAASGKPVIVEIIPLPRKRGWLPQWSRPEIQLEIA